MGENDELMFRVALTMIPGVGSVFGKRLVTMCGGAEAVFKEPIRYLRKMPHIFEFLSSSINIKELLLHAEQEVKFLEKYGIVPLWFQDKEYPQRLRHCSDNPVMLFYKGVADVNSLHVVSVVGTRKATDYGKACTRDIIFGLQSENVLVVSGLAYGIDSCAHKSAIEAGLNTIGVLGHGLDRIYPWVNRSLAEKMTMQGGLITEFLRGTKPDRENFPMRNRIIAGICDAVIVVEAGCKGGALITAEIANSYNRDVFAVPGRINDPFSEGVNYLVKTNRAALIQSASDIAFMMGWHESQLPVGSIQRKIMIEMTPEEERIVNLLKEKGKIGIDDLCIDSNLPMSKVSASLLNLEFEGVVRCLPGKIYTLN